ncbi:MAG: hypothetical protein IPQ06_09370 [Chitinophagaceae bacterium]|nr:hypothetical protein [Chitinophagaceae bacterium]MBL0273263.1 hypothetical protein [Chitinophagaceae bacterium]
MNLYRFGKPLVTCISVIILMLIVTSLFDILLVFFYSRFYSVAAFIVIFGVGGIFAGLLSYSYGMNASKEKDAWLRWFLITSMVLSGMLFFFLLSKLEGGEYEPAFKSYGITLALTSFLFAKGKIDL